MARAKKQEKENTASLKKRLKLLSRELEIEAALEKVRARAMTMQSSAKLAEISAIMFQQIKALGIDATRCGVGIFDDAHDAMEVWLTTASAGKKVLRVLDYVNLHIHPVYENILAARKKRKPYAITTLKGEQVKLYYNTLNAYMAGAGRKVFNAEEAFQSFFFDQGAINVTTVKPLSEDEGAIMVRFAKVFGLIYLRFVDLQKAELQANEARVEASLERVRGRALAMQKSDELPEVAALLYHELRQLGAGRHLYSGYVVIPERESIHGLHVRIPGSKAWEEYRLPAETIPLYQQIHEAWQQQEPVYYRSVGGTELKAICSQANKSTVGGKELKAFRRLPDPTVFYGFNFSQGYLHVASNSLLNDDEEALLIRLANVFELAFRRFIDIQKAEAQAREAMVEAALERIRARAMAMHSSAELMEVADVLREQLSLLGQPELETSALHFYNEEPGHIISWRAFRLGNKMAGKITKGRMAIPKDSCTLVEEWLEKFDKGLTEYTLEVSGAKQREWYEVLFHLAPEVGEAMIKRKATTEPRYYHFSTFSGGALLMVSVSLPSDGSIYLQRRAAGVFDLAYRRFLDLKLAEAQAKEAAVELGLERVRARAMAMHKSEELKEVIQVVYDQLIQLKLQVEHTGFIVDYKERDDMHIWLADQFVSPFEISIPYFDSPHWNSFIEAKEKGTNFFVNQLTFKEKNRFYKDLFKLIPTVPEGSQQAILQKPGLTISTVLLDNVGLYIENLSGIPFTDEENAILMRFGKVFQQSYTRFVDLQKAEAQAREAQIEVALERVRSRSMAMHKSEELPQVALVLLEQLEALGVSELDCAINIVDPDTKNFISYSAHSIRESNQKEFHQFPQLNLNDIGFLRKAVELVDADHSKFSLELKGELFKEIMGIWKVHGYPGLRNKKDFDETGVVYLSGAQFDRYSSISTTSLSVLTEDKMLVLERMAQTFGMSYTRFLDLQKAEAQAREAQIEAALERVRSRSMAMHKSEELLNVITVIAEQLQQLNFKFNTVSFGINSLSHDYAFWFAILGESTALYIEVPYLKNAMHDRLKDAMAQGLEFYSDTLTPEESKEWHEHLFSHAELPYLTAETKAYILRSAYARSIAIKPSIMLIVSNYAGKAYSNSENEIIKRFATVFEQSYTRFLDLQKAEKQAREAQIEASLERVRARTMAMHKSEELAEIAVTIHKELITLEFTPFIACGYVAIDEENQIQHGWTTKPDGSLMESYHLPLTGEVAMQNRYDAWKRKDQLFYQVLGGKELKRHIEFVSPYLGSKEVDQIVKTFFPDPTIFYCANFSHGYLSLITATRMTEAEEILFTRFRRVFEQSYARFLDLQKAEAQARESEIQLALERVRARAMAMHHSDELKEVASVMREQFAQLGQIQLETVAIHLYPEDGDTFTSWFAIKPPDNPGKVETFTTRFSKSSTQLAREMFSLYESRTGEYTVHASGAAMKEWMEMILAALPDLKKLWGDHPPEQQYWYFSDFSAGSFLLIPREEPSKESKDLLKRSAAVFDLAYRRYADLRKAESQAREAQIEASLERVRGKAMAMHNSEDLAATVDAFFVELRSLGVTPRRCGVTLITKDTRIADLTATTATMEGESRKITGKLKLTGHEVLDQVYDHWNLQKEYHPVLRGKEIAEYYGVMNPQVAFPEFAADDIQYGHYFFFKEGGVYTWTEKELPEEALTIYRRFTSVLSLTYRRYNDLRQAEEQAREAQIEAALERVRSRSMAMHKSEELLNVITVIAEQLQQLNFKFNTVSFGINSLSHDYTFWFAILGDPTPVYIQVPYLKNVMFDRLKDALAQGLEFYSDTLTPEESKEWHEHVFVHAELPYLTAETKAYILRSAYARSIALKPSIMLIVSNYAGNAYSNSENEIIKRFATVFEQSYTRFLDLKKAEAQAREATIQASLERVRAKAMAMHNSKDLAETIEVFYQELVSMNLTPRRCGIGLMEKGTHVAEISSMNTTEEDISVETIGHLDMQTHPVLVGVYEHWIKQKEYRPVLRGHEIKAYYQVLRKQVTMPDYPPDAVHFGHFFFFEEGGVYAWTEKELLEDELGIYRRFTSVLSLTYKRYKDLKDAEARAKEAVKQASLDRVRAEIASMRNADDLQRITPLIWRELTTLGVPFFRCGVMIVHEKEHHVDFYLSTPEGRPLAALHLDSNGQEITKKALEHWRRQAVYTDHWDREQFAAFAQSMIKEGQIQNTSAYQGGEQPPESLTLQFTPFAQGMLYVGSAEPLSSDQLELVHALADAFSTAYARYEDFTRLEAAKATVENALKELRTTQTQLVQSEKMASLGELTAGIAHEIQNPLNFVNNFSEVSKELLDEMEEELKKGNNEDALQIAKDIIQNLEKINFHGKRADGIVKSMLQHSRKSTGQKEPTDINALCDEYLRLSYHGLRAKDKSFNAKFETDLDPAVGSLSVLPQEIGRVVLNLINNAFYAVSEKKKLNLDGYEPTVTVSTKKTGTHIEILVRDNGTGIPQKALDKIFNPFFTTKPTGQGTGLGLSLSYDIITKGHGGEVSVHTKEGEGSDFTILLPVQ